ncbi:MAG: RNA polymerase factor sigma-54 [Thiomonas arsenitoxydans]|uniref:RNA polymerase sigma-54 factor n=1 Tax=Thiomonas arsenitoxydans (strain DSM 22701 / CIP 110005 / 3As) TaxID=426114 RepID=A0A8I1MXF1_THIA3|nr:MULTISPECIES: RNA polymerase factor sigma-54 [Thiomonas]MBN8744058.1 RNA polymerase factor sigma-54 [Thiomonas arsenitoxydans]ODU96043.1 MAG: RNA polymerase sigma-54 factor [Thiomonas sp. SCN 64-16]
MKPSLNLRLSQHLALTPQLQQSIRLLQLSTLELTQEIEGLLESNPFLEPEEEQEAPAAAPTSESPPPLAPDPSQTSVEGHDAAAEPAAELQLDTQDWTASSGETDHGADTDADADSWVSSGQSVSGGGGDDDEFSALDIASEHLDLRDHLRGQLAGLALSATDRAAAEAIIDSLDDDGYLPDTPLELAQALAPAADAEQLEDLADALTTAMRLIQSFDPAGVAAHDLPDCLCLQLQRQASCPVRELALQICRGGHLDLLAKRDWRKLERQLEADEAALRLAQQRIAQLDPHPGSAFRRDAAQAVTPDVIARKTPQGWVAQLNPEVMPRLRVNQIYADAMRRARDSGGAMQGQLQEARWFVKNVQQRFETIQRVSQTIVERQQRFFDFGPVAMRPMVLREIADELGLHESTISRVTTQKFMLTPFGTVELKYFFGSGLSTEAGGNTSSTAVRELIRRLVAEEDSAKPLSDSELAERLTQQGVQVARRTVAKYREALRIAPANLRKSG